MVGQDLDVAISGAGIGVAPPPLTVAHVISPVDVEVGDIATVTIGRSNQPAGDITITETVEGALLEEHRLEVEMVDQFGRSLVDWAVQAISPLQIQNYDFEILGDELEMRDWTAAQGRLDMEVTYESYAEPATIEFTNVRVGTTIVLPEQNRDPYGLLVAGSAIVNNWALSPNLAAQRRGLFSGAANRGIIEPYVRSTTAGSTDGFDRYREFTMSTAAPYWYSWDGGAHIELADEVFRPRLVDGTSYLSIRFLSIHFIQEEVRWNPETSTATVIVPALDGGRDIIEFVSGSDIMTVNGRPIPMLHPDGSVQRAIIIDERMFIPIRQLALALGLTNDAIVWDEATATVTLNPRTAQ
jgi:hypothetical protein